MNMKGYELKNKNLHLEKINADNFLALYDLEVSEEQKQFVASNRFSMAEAYARLSNGQFVQCFGIIDGDTPVGFAMIGHDVEEEGSPESVNKCYLLWRFMIGQQYQRRGYGRDALHLLLDWVLTFPDGPSERFSTTYEPNNEAAKHLYTSFGFIPTGEKDCDDEEDAEDVAVLPLTDRMAKEIKEQKEKLMKHTIFENATKELTAQNGAAALGYADENMWFSEKPDYAACVRELIETVREQEIRASILIATDEDVIFACGARSKDRNGETVTPLSTFEIGSLTKMHTAVLIFKLIEEGRLALTDKVTKFFPDYAKAGEMTVFDLLHMRSGIVDFANDAEIFFGDEETVEALDRGEITDEIFLGRLKACDLTFEPGSKMEYSNTNYVLLAMIVEQLTGKSYKENAEERIFRPLGMEWSSATTFGDVTSMPEGEEGYMMEYKIARGAGDVHENAVDLLKFDRAFFNGRLVNRASMDGILDFVDGYGCGWENSEKYDLVCHGGETNSYYCLNYVLHPAGKRTYFLMLTCCNSDDEEDEDQDETAEAADNEANDEAEFNQYQTIFDIVKKHLL